MWSNSWFFICKILDCFTVVSTSALQQMRTTSDSRSEGFILSTSRNTEGEGKRRKNITSSLIHGCVTCRKLRGTPQTQEMADLPADRLYRTSIHERGHRCVRTMDHIITPYERWPRSQGPVKLICSDRGTNFVGACKELKIPSNVDNAAVEKFLLDQGCAWKFNVPHASHMGDSWERMFGVARKILDSMFLQLGTLRLIHEALSTLRAEVAAIINARPLIPVSTDPDDPFILTPATLLTQKVSVPSAPVGDWIKDLHKSQWRQVQHLAQTFWDRWKKQYLASLQQRQKWQAPTPDIQPGSIVLLKGNQLLRNEWPLGLITQVFPSNDGMVRKVEVKVSKTGGTKLYQRPISETVLLLSPDKKQ
nr:uncharacterized protein LOC125990052 isoform X1 [Syngnathus scovelli]